MDQTRDCLQVLSRVLGDSVLGAYRFGSAVAGGLRPASDLDVLVVTRQPLRVHERRALVDGLLGVSGHRTGRRPLEVTVVARDDVRPWRYPPTADLVFGEWLFEEIERDGPPARQPCPDLAIAITQVRQSGVALLGPPPEDLLDPVPPEDVVRAATDGIPALLADLDGDERNVALTVARIWVTVETGRILPKDEAAVWAADRLPDGLRPVMEHARRLYLDSSYAEETWPQGLREQVGPLAEHIIDRVSRSCAAARRHSVAGSAPRREAGAMAQQLDDPPALPWVAQDRDPTWTCAPSAGEAREFHETLPDYAATPLVPLAGLADELGVGQVFAKDESTRLGLPAFKALGASWAVRQVSAGQPGRALTLTTATDGNHGRAVARFARLLGHGARIFVPPELHPDAVTAIEQEGAEVVLVDGSYDDAVAAAARAGREPGVELVQDTAWEGYEQVPQWIVDGYGTLFAELDEQVAAAGCLGPDLVAVPTGVGSLLQAALAHYRSADATPGTAVVSVEPDTAAWGPASLLAGKAVSVRTGRTVMHGLNCGTPSSAAWPFVVAGLDGAVTVTGEAAITAARDLARLGVAAGPCGAAPVAALRSVLGGPGDAERRRHLSLGPDATVIVLVTEGSAANPLPGATG